MLEVTRVYKWGAMPFSHTDTDIHTHTHVVLNCPDVTQKFCHECLTAIYCASQGVQ